MPNKAKMKHLRKVEQDRKDAMHRDELRRLPRLQRLSHVKVHRHAIGLTLGFGVMFLGSSMALTHQTVIHGAIWDMIAYFIHGFGSLPVLHHA